MQKFFLLVLILVGGYYAHDHFSKAGPSFGTSSSRSIGDYDDIASYLEKQGTTRRDLDPRFVRDAFDGALDGRTDFRVKEFKSGASRATVVQSPGGKLLGVACQFKSGSIEYSHSSDIVGRFAALYWQDIFGSTPVFALKDEDGIRMAQQRKDKALCTWRKDASDGDDHTVDLVTFLVTKTMIRNKAVKSPVSNQ